MLAGWVCRPTDKKLGFFLSSDCISMMWTDCSKQFLQITDPASAQNITRTQQASLCHHCERYRSSRRAQQDARGKLGALRRGTSDPLRVNLQQSTQTRSVWITCRWNHNQIQSETGDAGLHTQLTNWGKAQLKSTIHRSTEPKHNTQGPSHTSAVYFQCASKCFWNISNV